MKQKLFSSYLLLILSIIMTIVLVFLITNESKMIKKENKILEKRLQNCCIGYWIDSETGIGYTGSRWHFKDIPVNPMTGKSCY